MDASALRTLFDDAKAGRGSVDGLFAAAKKTGGQSDTQTLLKAARTGDAAALSAVLEATPGLDMNCCGEWDGMTALHWCAEKGHLEMARALVTAGANVNAPDGQKWPPLLAAVTKNRHPMVRLLLELGADKDVRVGGRVVDWRAHAVDDEMLAILLPGAGGHDDAAARKRPRASADGVHGPSSRTRSKA